LKPPSFPWSGFLLILGLSLPAAGGVDEPVFPWDGSRTTPVHRIPIIDEDGGYIIPDSPNPPPLPSRTTCGPCHSYELIRGGWHFNSTRAGVPPGRTGEPWVWVDEKTGSQIPLSYRDWVGVWNPEDLGVTTWRFAAIFGRHLPGGDMGEPEEETPDSRWQVSGRLELNCLGCHASSPRQDQAEWARQVSRENFRWAATAANALGEVGGMASRVHDTWSIYDGPNLDDNQWAVRPYVDYDLSRFDSRHYAIFELEYEPPDRRCLFCHSVYPTGQPRWTAPRDVHTEAAIGCAGCHRNSLDHRMIRGYEGEAAQTRNPAAEPFTCRGCHSGPPGAAGRLGAPRARHRGLPPIHLDRMSCTSCHSGVVPRDATAHVVRMSRINRTGIHGRARWFTDLPRVVEPVFARDADGGIAPFRAFWPAFWARLEEGKAVPLPPDEVEERTRGVLDAERQVGDLLAFLSAVPDVTGTPVLFYDGTVYRRDVDGKVEAAPYDGSLDAAVWGWDVDGDYRPLAPSPEFDEEGLMLVDVETAVLAVLEALRSTETGKGRPVMVFKGDVYWAGLEGWLESEAYEGEPRDVPFWGWRADGNVEPLVPAFVLRAVAQVDGRGETLTEEQIALGLEALAGGGGDPEYAYVAAGMMFRLGENGRLAAADSAQAAPLLWPLAHEVRPAAQSLGSGGCADCHRDNAPFFSLLLTGTGPLVTDRRASAAAADLMGVPPRAVRWGAWREQLLKPLTLPVTAAFVVLLLLHCVLFGSHLHPAAPNDRDVPRHNALSRLGHYLLFLSVFAVAGTGFLFLLGDADPLGTQGQLLARRIHWIVGLAMAIGLVLIAVVWLKQMGWARYDSAWLAALGGYLGVGHNPPAGKFNAGQKIFFWWTLAVGAVLVVTGIAMLSGIRWSPTWQARLYTLHDAAGLLMILSILLHVYLSVLVDPHSIRSVFGGRVRASWARERHSEWEPAKSDDSP